MFAKYYLCYQEIFRKCKRRGVGGQKKPNLVNVVCERPLRGVPEPTTSFIVSALSGFSE